MIEEATIIIFDDELIMDVNTGIIQPRSTLENNELVLINDIKKEVDKLDAAITDLETSLDPRTTSILSETGREGVYQKVGLLTNIILGVIIALVVIILLI